MPATVGVVTGSRRARARRRLRRLAELVRSKTSMRMLEQGTSGPVQYKFLPGNIHGVGDRFLLNGHEMLVEDIRYEHVQPFNEFVGMVAPARPFMVVTIKARG